MIIKHKLINIANNYLAAKQINALSNLFGGIRCVLLKFNFLLTNRSRIKKVSGLPSLKLHVGCGNKRLDGYINVDMVAGSQVDILVDLNTFQFKENCCEAIFSHAFFEHISIPCRVDHLKGALKCLKKSGGSICYIGIPYFGKLVELYLKEEDGPDGTPLKASQFCKFTHGGTTMNIIGKGIRYVRFHPTYLYAELHKALYDEKELKSLLEESGFTSYIIFTTVCPKDKNPLPSNIGFYASNLEKTKNDLIEECMQYLAQFDGEYVDKDKISIVET